MERAETDAWNYLKQQQVVDLYFWVPIFTQIANGIQELHERNIIFRDLHLANVLLFPDGNGVNIFYQ